MPLFQILSPLVSEGQGVRGDLSAPKAGNLLEAVLKVLMGWISCKVIRDGIDLSGVPVFLMGPNITNIGFFLGMGG